MFSMCFYFFTRTVLIWKFFQISSTRSLDIFHKNEVGIKKKNVKLFLEKYFYNLKIYFRKFHQKTASFITVHAGSLTASFITVHAGALTASFITVHTGSLKKFTKKFLNKKIIMEAQSTNWVGPDSHGM